jgi:hypothetical protein
LNQILAVQGLWPRKRVKQEIDRWK